jgi:hypothetical protein
VFITPYDLSVSLWHATMPVYEWVPEPVAQPPAANAGGCLVEGAASAGAASGPATAWPRMRLVFRGTQTVVFPVWTSRENLFWEQAAQLRREEDESRNEDRLRAARSSGVSAAPPIDTGTDPGWEEPQ